MYNKINVQRHLEHRKCLNCGKEWDIWVKKYDLTKQVCFCKECCSILTQNERRKLKNKLLPEFREKYNKLKRESSRRHIVHNLLMRAKRRSRIYGYEFNIEDSDIIIPEVCPILEVPIILGNKQNYEYTPSLDRIDNSKGYVKGNIRVISKKANSMKNSASQKELITFCKNILRYSPNITENESNDFEDKEPQS